MSVRIFVGNTIDRLRALPDNSVHCAVTSPPYFGLRSYLPDGHPDKQYEIGLETSPAEYVETLVAVFREVRRVLRSDGTVWLNLGDSYSGGGGFSLDAPSNRAGSKQTTQGSRLYNGRQPAPGLKPKDLIGIPWSVAFALRADGWYLRRDIIWCLSGGAWVYARTQKGDMPIMVKDLVRLDPRTVKLWNGQKWTQVVGWGPSNDTTERLELVLRSGERIGCTGSHLWPTDRGNVAARDLQAGDKIATCSIPEPDGCAWPAYLIEDALWLAGLYLAEGSRSNTALSFALSRDELPWVERIRNVAEHYGGSVGYTVNGGSLTVRVWGRVIQAIIACYVGGVAAIDKHMNVATWRLPNAALKHIIQGYLDGDGHNDIGNNRWRIGFCRNYSLERDLRTAAARLGATLTLKPGTATFQGGELPSFRGEWRWERSGHWNEKDRGEVVEVRNSRGRHFWDIAVEDEPHLFALASGVLTHNCKPNPMPESVTDRCTTAHEYLFMLTKADRYFYDAAAIAEPAAETSLFRYQHEIPRAAENSKGKLNRWGGDNRSGSSIPASPSTRNKRSVWTIATAPFPEAHFATFPPDLVEPCIKAGTSERGVCTACGTPWVRVVDREKTRPGITGGATPYDSNRPDGMTLRAGGFGGGSSTTTGWQPSCACNAAVMPATVLDPFSGAGTTLLVADRLGRDAIGIELNADYAAMSQRRLEQDAGMFAQTNSDELFRESPRAKPVQEAMPI